MADGQGNINRPHTGTVPKIKYSNNAAAIHSSRDQSRGPRMSNNLTPSWYVNADSTNFIQNKRRNQRNKYSTMDIVLDGSEIPNGIVNYSTNGITPTTSSSTSRRNSVGSTPKCDNVAKYPDRKQIDDKLKQIREYLEVTSSLMTSIRNSDEQIFDIDEKTNLLQMRNDLLDSEKKLVNLLEEIDNNQNAESSFQGSQVSLSNIDNSSEHSGDYIKRAESDINSFDNELTSLRDQQLSLLSLQQKSENRLADARRIQEKMLLPHCSNQVNLAPQKSNKNISLLEFDTAIKDLEARAKRLNRNKPNEKYTADKLMTEMQNLQSQIISMHEANNEREQLIEVLDNRDTELRSQQAELKKKLFELQNKKEQVDQLVMQLQTMDEDNQSDVGMQVRNIVTMKDQLTKLKDMLDIVNNTADAASPAEVQAAANQICLTAENLQNEIAKPTHRRNDSYVENRLDNHVSNETYQKESNKTQRNQGARPKQRTSSINEKLALQSELEAKKRELEEIMGKHKAATSNLNHDVRGSAVNDMSWKPPIFCQDQGSEDRLSSDGDENEYSEVRETQNIIFPQQMNSLYGSNRSKRGMDSRSECDLPTERLQNLTHTPERNLRGISVNSSEFVRQQPRASNNQNQEKLQKQLELIKCVCDSVLEQIPNNQQSSNNQPPSNIQQVRNNITPSSVFSEQQRISSPSSPFRPNHNQVNVFNPTSDMPWSLGQNNIPGVNQSDVNGYQNWFATNSLQTQSFMLNTLNQCCQMLWLQQRELAAVRSTVNVLQERLDMQQSYPSPGNLPPHPPHQANYNQPGQNQTPNNQLRPPPTPKTNQVSAACSLPNLNQYTPVPSNSDLAFANTSNVPNSGLLESCLNNANHLNATQAIDHANNMLHVVNSNLNTIPAQIWNGQALNNQVPPGNRANNYWDNFRSYSRQNQLSSKNSESSFQNVASGIDRFNCERVNPFPLMTTSKSNSEHSSTNSHENTPRKTGFNGLRQNIENVKVSADHHAPPPDVLNVNQNLPKTSFDQSMPNATQPEQRPTIEELELDLHRLLNINSQRSNPTLTENVDDDRSNSSREPKHERRRNDWSDEQQEDQRPKQRRRNDWSDEQQEDQRPKQNKLVDELRENVYKEVASLISANETRPHFLIQLFKDLQKIESDSLRLKILQSIQNILTQSIHYQQNSVSRQQTESDSITLSESSEQASVWSRPTKQFASDILNMRLECDEPFLQNSYKEIVGLLEASEDDVIGTHLLINIKQVFLESDLFEDSVKDTVFLKHFSNVLNDVLEQYRGKKVHDVKIHLIQTIGDLLQGELSFIHLIQETIPESCMAQERKDSSQSNTAYSVASALFDIPNQGPLQNNDNIQNGDLAEADQSRLGESELEEEGAVGGVLESYDEESKVLSQGQSEEVLNLPIIDFPTNGEGLDQVPTRLPTKVKSEATTPTKDLLNSHHDQEPY